MAATSTLDSSAFLSSRDESMTSHNTNDTSITIMQNNNNHSNILNSPDHQQHHHPHNLDDVEWSDEELKDELRKAVVVLSHGCLKLAAKWASEQLMGLPVSSQQQEQEQHSHAVPDSLLPPTSDREWYAKSLMELGEYAHAAAVLSLPQASVSNMAAPLADLTSYGIYLRAYALYLAGEKRKEEELVELREPLERTKIRNKYATQISQELRQAYELRQLDALGFYVYGMVLLQEPSSTPKAHTILVESLLHFPWNWSAWQDLATQCLKDAHLLEQIEADLEKLHHHYMYRAFCAHVLAETQEHEQSLTVLDTMVPSCYVHSKMAVAHYHLREFDSAQQYFSTVLEQDPYRLQDMDVYSNILYVQEDLPALSQLAHLAVQVDKYLPETCCIVGNYYSAKSQRTKAVQYFQRALKLNRNYTSAWTLMGHEYVELKNTAAAMEAYRRAVDVSPKDYRAWYGLGQTYEFLNMHLYALFYYRKAASLRPYDARMWCAIAGCYLGLGRKPDAIRSYERAVSHQDSEGIATQKLATLYRQDGQTEKAAQCFMRHLELRYLTTTKHPPTSLPLDTVLNGVLVQAPEAEALLFLASYHRTHGEYETAALCCSRLLEYPGPEKEEGKAILREIRSRRERSSGPPETPRNIVGLLARRDESRREGDSRQDESLSVDFSP